jgi:hypothetical protein
MIRAATALLIAGLAAFGSKPVFSSNRAPQAARVDGNVALASAPFELVQSHVVIALDLNGAGQKQFVVDTGMAGVLLDAGAAQDAGLRLAGRPHENLIGNGEGKAKSFSVKSVSLQLGSQQIFSGHAHATDLEFLSKAMGEPIAGVVGRPFFQKYIVTIDYADRVLKLYDPSTYEFHGGGETIPVQIKGVPLMDVWIGEPGGKRVKAKVEIDTGSEAAILLNAPFESSNNLPQTGQVTVPFAISGLGGDFEATEGRLENLQIGKLEVDRPLAIFSKASKGLTSTRKYDGSIGGDMLRRFTITFDYPRKRVMLEPNTLLDTPFRTGTEISGLLFGSIRAEASSGTLSIIKGSAAAAAGFQDGDKILMINGKPSSDYTLDELEHIFSTEGATIHIGIERAGKQIEITIKTPRLG